MGIMTGSGSTSLLTFLGETALGNLMTFQSSDSSKAVTVAVKVMSPELRLRGEARDTAWGNSPSCSQRPQEVQESEQKY